MAERSQPPAREPRRPTRHDAGRASGCAAGLGCTSYSACATDFFYNLFNLRVEEVHAVFPNIAEKGNEIQIFEHGRVSTPRVCVASNAHLLNRSAYQCVRSQRGKA